MCWNLGSTHTRAHTHTHRLRQVWASLCMLALGSSSPAVLESKALFALHDGAWPSQRALALHLAAAGLCTLALPMHILIFDQYLRAGTLCHKPAHIVPRHTCKDTLGPQRCMQSDDWRVSSKRRSRQAMLQLSARVLPMIHGLRMVMLMLVHIHGLRMVMLMRPCLNRRSGLCGSPCLNRRSELPQEGMQRYTRTFPQERKQRCIFSEGRE